MRRYIFYATHKKYKNVPFSRPFGASENDAQKMHKKTAAPKGTAVFLYYLRMKIRMASKD